MRVHAAAVAVAIAATAGAGTALASAGLPTAHPAATARAEVRARPGATPVDPPPVPAGQTPAQAVAPLRTLRVPDLLVTTPGAITQGQLAALRAIPGMSGLTTLDLADVRLPTGRLIRLAGVDPSQFRQFTPRETAGSDPLWAAVARGEITPTYGLVRARSLTLGATVTLRGTHAVGARIGGIAVFGVPGLEIVASRSVAAGLGATAARAVLVSAPRLRLPVLRAAVAKALGPGSHDDVLRPQTVRAYRGRPRTYRDLYVQSARYCPGLRWQVLAAIGQVESGHGRNVGPSSAGALGPMQFLPSTWAYAGVDGDGDGKADIQNPLDAVPSAALYLCRAGASTGDQGLYDAVFSYNHADWYVKLVLDLAARYR